MWLNKNIYLVKILNSFLSDLASPVNLLWFWNFGFILGMAIVVQVISGIILALYYSDSVSYAFYSVVYLEIEVQIGYLIRFIHSTGASLLFILIYIHIGRRFWFKSMLIVSVLRGRGFNFCFNNGGFFFRLCFAMRPDVFLSGYCNY